MWYRSGLFLAASPSGQGCADPPPDISQSCMSHCGGSNLGKGCSTARHPACIRHSGTYPQHGCYGEISCCLAPPWDWRAVRSRAAAGPRGKGEQRGALPGTEALCGSSNTLIPPPACLRCTAPLLNKAHKRAHLGAAILFRFSIIVFSS